jgi:predicted enzyme related to lactoylglutathione lyase
MPAVSAHRPSRIVHLELHTHDVAAATRFYRELLRWRIEQIDTQCGSYHALALEDGLGGGIVGCGATRGKWLPYVEVEDLVAITERARRCGAAVLLGPREGPAGWRSVLATSESGEIALWQPKRRLVGASG